MLTRLTAVILLTIALSCNNSRNANRDQPNGPEEALKRFRLCGEAATDKKIVWYSIALPLPNSFGAQFRETSGQAIRVWQTDKEIRTFLDSFPPLVTTTPDTSLQNHPIEFLHFICKEDTLLSLSWDYTGPYLKSGDRYYGVDFYRLSRILHQQR